MRVFPFLLLAFLSLSTCICAQSTGTLEGNVTDQDSSSIEGAEVTAFNEAIGILRTAETDKFGRYQIAALPVGDYRMEVRAHGFQTQLVPTVRLEVGRHLTQNFELRVGDVSEQVMVLSTGELIENATISVGHMIDRTKAQEIPLNGRYFLDLGLLTPGSVISPQNAFAGSPMRGLGALAMNTSGNREDMVNYVINGITLNDLTFNAINFQPSISTVQEFKVNNSTLSAEYGQSAGAVVDIATRSGGNGYHVELFEFFRNDALDARNFFNFTSHKPPPFKRNQFGGDFGGPILKDKLFFFFAYEGLRLRQRFDINSLVLSEAQRQLVTDPVITRLLPLIPHANFVDSTGNSRFVDSTNAPVDSDQWTLDISYNLNASDRIHGYYAFYDTLSVEPIPAGNNLPGYGNYAKVRRQMFTLNETHIFSPTLVNEARVGVSRLSAATTPVAQLNPATFGINNGITEPIGLPQINVAGGGLNFGGPSPQPSGRGNTTFVVADSLTYLVNRHALRLGGEFRQFLNNNFRRGTGTFNFPTVASFIAGNANSFSVTLGNQSSSIAEAALGFYVQDNFQLRPNLSFELGLRYEWNMTPTERYDRFIVFDPATASLIRTGKEIPEVYHQNNKNIQPRVGLVWDPLKDGRTAIRMAYALMTDPPMTSVVTPLAANPPLAIPLTFSGTIRLDNAILLAGAAGLAPQSINHGFDN